MQALFSLQDECPAIDDVTALLIEHGPAAMASCLTTPMKRVWHDGRCMNWPGEEIVILKHGRPVARVVPARDGRPWLALRGSDGCWAIPGFSPASARCWTAA